MTEPGGGILLDTHVAIWLAHGDLSPSALRALDDHRISGISVSPVNAWEIGLLALGSARKTSIPHFLPTPAAWFGELLTRFGFAVAPLTWEIALESSALPGSLHRDPADRLLIATARTCGLTLMSSDSAILEYAAEGHVRALAC